MAMKPSTNPTARDKQVVVLFNEEERGRIDEAAKELGMSRAAYIRHAVLVDPPQVVRRRDL